MNPLLSTVAGPLEGFTAATWRHGISDVGYGQVEADPGLVDVQDIVDCDVDGLRFRWRVEEEDRTDDDTTVKVWSGRGLAADLERTVVLPSGYPSHTSRVRSMTGPPLAIWRTLALEAQARGRLSWLTVGFTATTDSDGTGWSETVDVELEPGVDLLSLLDSMCEVEGAEWIVDPDGTLRVAPQVGDDLSGQVVLFVGRDQLSRSRRGSSRDVRHTVYLEASTGVSEATSTAAVDAGEVWLESEDFADPTSRAAVAGKLAAQAGAAKVEVEVAVPPAVGLYDRFQVGDLVGLDDGVSVTPVRVVAATVSQADTTEVELTLVDQVELRRRTIERAIEAKADVKLAANVSLQRRHGLVRADKIETGSLQADADISSSDYVAGTQGWIIKGDGEVEFDRGTFRGDLAAAGGTFSGTLSAVDGTFTGTLSGVDGTFSGTLSAVNGTFNTLTGGTMQSSASGERVVISNDDRILFYNDAGSLRSQIRLFDGDFVLQSPSQTHTKIQSQIDVYLEGRSIYLSPLTTASEIYAQGQLLAPTSTSPRYSFSGRSTSGMGYDTGNNWIRFNNLGSTVLVVGTSSVVPGSNNTYALGASGLRWTEVWATNGTIQTSDARAKSGIEPNRLGLDVVRSLETVRWRWDGPDDGKEHVGIDADHLEQVLAGHSEPLAHGVVYNPAFERQAVIERFRARRDAGEVPEDETEPSLPDSDGLKGVNYAGLIPILIEAVKELDAELAEVRRGR